MSASRSGSNSRGAPWPTTAPRSTPPSRTSHRSPRRPATSSRCSTARAASTRGFIRDTGVVFEALTERQGRLRDLVVNSNRLWETTARRDVQLADTFRVLPTFLREGRETTRRLTRFADNTNPLVDQLRPAAREIRAHAHRPEGPQAPDLRGFFTDLDPLVRTARRGLPATEQVLDNTRPILARLDPFLRQVTPILDYLGLYKREIAAFFANDAAASQATGTTSPAPARCTTSGTVNPTNPEMLAAYPNRSARTARTRTRSRAATTSCAPRGISRCSAATSCTSNPVPAPPAPAEPWLPPDLVQLIQRFVYGARERRRRTALRSPGPARALRGPGGRLPAPAAAALASRALSAGTHRCTRPSRALADASLRTRPSRALGARRHLILARWGVWSTRWPGGRCSCSRPRPCLRSRRRAGPAPRAQRRHRHPLVDRGSRASRPPSASSGTSRTRPCSCSSRGDLARTVLTADLNRVLGGRGPRRQRAGHEAGPRQPPPVCREIAELDPAKVAYGGATFINTAVAQIQDEPAAPAGGDRAGRAPPRRLGGYRRAGRPASRAAPPRGRGGGRRSGAVHQRGVRLALRYGLSGIPRINDPSFVSTLWASIRARRAS